MLSHACHRQSDSSHEITSTPYHHTKTVKTQGTSLEDNTQKNSKSWLPPMHGPYGFEVVSPHAYALSSSGGPTWSTKIRTVIKRKKIGQLKLPSTMDLPSTSAMSEKCVVFISNKAHTQVVRKRIKILLWFSYYFSFKWKVWNVYMCARAENSSCFPRNSQIDKHPYFNRKNWVVNPKMPTYYFCHLIKFSSHQRPPKVIKLYAEKRLNQNFFRFLENLGFLKKLPTFKFKILVSL